MSLIDSRCHSEDNSDSISGGISETMLALLSEAMDTPIQGDSSCPKDALSPSLNPAPSCSSLFQALFHQATINCQFSFSLNERIPPLTLNLRRLSYLESCIGSIVSHIYEHLRNEPSRILGHLDFFTETKKKLTHLDWPIGLLFDSLHFDTAMELHGAKVDAWQRLDATACLIDAFQSMPCRWHLLVKETTVSFECQSFIETDFSTSDRFFHHVKQADILLHGSSARSFRLPVLDSKTYYSYLVDGNLSGYCRIRNYLLKEEGENALRWVPYKVMLQTSTGEHQTQISSLIPMNVSLMTFIEMVIRDEIHPILRKWNYSLETDHLSWSLHGIPEKAWSLYTQLISMKQLLQDCSFGDHFLYFIVQVAPGDN